MSDEKSQQQTSTESTVAGAAKTGKAISNIAKGAAAGGAHGAAIEAGKSSAKWLIPLIAAVLLPLILVAMLPSIIFGSLLGDGTDSPNGISNDEVLVQNNQAFLTRPLRYAIMDYLKENPMERFGSCAICIVHNYDAALGKRRIRDYDNIETKRYLDVIESMLLTNDSGLLCTVLQATRMSDRDSAEFYLMRPETLSSWAKNHIKTTTKTCSE